MATAISLCTALQKQLWPKNGHFFGFFLIFFKIALCTALQKFFLFDLKLVQNDPKQVWKMKCMGTASSAA